MFVNPKRSGAAAGELYSYYAGFSPAFVAAALRDLELTESTTLLDPWNGAGTTTRVATRLGFAVRGFDINPVMVLVAKAALLTDTVKPSMSALAHDLAERAIISDALRDQDPLLDWFERPGAAWLRGIEAAIRHTLLPNSNSGRLASCSSLAHVSSLASFFYTALFRVIRAATQRFRTSNPTWVCRAGASRVRNAAETLKLMFLREVDQMESAIGQAPSNPDGAADAIVALGDSTSLSLENASIDAVISSPPYCTRIDYAVATLPELALLGADAASIRALRDRMIGTPTITKDLPFARTEWGRTCNDFLAAVAAHRSKASGTYYSKIFRSYFARMDGSLRELRRVTKAGANVILVVQDSYYKDIHNDLPTMLMEMAGAHAFGLRDRCDFTMTNGLRAINTRARAYRRASDSVETVLLLENQ